MRISKAFKATGMALAGAGALLVLDAWVLEHILFSVKRYALGKPNEEGERIRLLHLTDLHLKQRLALKHSKLAKKINNLKPAVLLISGDMIDKTGSVAILRSFLQMIDKDIRILGIPGNNEYQAAPDLETLKETYREFEAELLVNETRIIQMGNRRLAVTGMDDCINGKADFKKAVENVGREPNHLVLIHSPKYRESIIKECAEINKNRPAGEKLRIRYLLAGHNHGGQVTLGDYAPVMPKYSGGYVRGWYHGEEPYLYVSKGFGTSTIPFRFMARAEITLLDYYLNVSSI